MVASKKGFSAHELHRSIGVTNKTAWFMFHRLREAMSAPDTEPVGGEGKIVAADEAYHGKRKTPPGPSPQRYGRPYIKKNRPPPKRPIAALMELDGEARVKHMAISRARTSASSWPRTPTPSPA